VPAIDRPEGLLVTMAVDSTGAL